MRSLSDLEYILQLEDPRLRHLFLHSAHLEQLNAEIAPCLPSSLRDICKVVNFSDDKIVLATPNSQCTARLRFGLAHVQAKFQAHPVLKDFKHIECKTVLGLHGQPNSQQKKIRHLPTSSSHLCVETLAEAVSQPKLSEALNKLGKQLKRLQKN